MEEAGNKKYICSLVFFWIIVALFIITTAGMFLDAIPAVIPYMGFIIAVPFRILLSILGIVLIILVAKSGFTKAARAFFILTGAAAICMGLSAILHNLVYALFIKLFGQNFWGNMGDEPVFFILATIICPIAILVGIIGSIILIAKRKVLPPVQQ
ncbi:MAG: hypothetical protein JW770_04090 [Actinobacteria bacterium]|nr:hypothetical protein [Actinomycetota bacterium]